jgi:hypothetical protein
MITGGNSACFLLYWLNEHLKPNNVREVVKDAIDRSKKQKDYGGM